jgi:hypothetical protein
LCAIAHLIRALPLCSWTLGCRCTATTHVTNWSSRGKENKRRGTGSSAGLAVTEVSCSRLSPSACLKPPRRRAILDQHRASLIVENASTLTAPGEGHGPAAPWLASTPVHSLTRM